MQDRLLRPRLVSVLRQRFDRRLVSLTAPAGFGKTTALVQALQQNELEPVGTDVWIPISTGDEDRQLFGRIVARLTNESEPPEGMDLADVLDAVLAQTPREVALVFDDVHFSSASVVAAIAALIDELPANGHVVVGSRFAVVEASARLISSGDVLQVVADELAFDAAEVEAICTAHGAVDVTKLGAEARWPAQLALGLRSDRDTQARYLAEELIAEMPEARRAELAQLAVLGAANDSLVSRVTAGQIRSVDAIVAGLPLVDRFDNGMVRLHDLWAEALRSQVSDERRSELQVGMAHALIDEGRFVDAMELALAAGELVLFETAAKLMARQPQTSVTLVDVRRCIDMVSHTQLRVLGKYFGILEEWCVHGASGLGERMLSVAGEAGESGDHQLQAVLLFRTIQVFGDQTMQWGSSLVDQIDSLPDDGDPDMALTKWFFAVVTHSVAGRIPEALKLLDELAEIAGPMTPHYQAMLYSDLGRPELVTGDAFRDDMGVARMIVPAIELFVAQASWLRGDLPPELALELGAGLAQRTRRRNVTHQIVPQLAVFTMIATAAGDDAYADEQLALLDQADIGLLGGNVATFAHTVRAVVAAARGDDDNATDHFRRALGLSGLAPWPYRSWLYALLPAYVLLPDQRESIDGLDLGPTLTSVVAAGRALVAMREDNTTEGMADLGWSKPNVLRVHVPVAMLAELCVGGDVAGVTEARTVLDELPDAGAHLRRVANRYSGKIASRAKALAKLFPIAPSSSIEVRLCGPIELLRGDQLVTEATWRRARVQELFAFLLLNPRISRGATAAAIWPDLDDDAAMNNLRVHLSYLSKVLEPDRERGAPPWFVRSEGDSLVLDPARVESDLQKLIRASNEAGSADQAGIPGQAIVGYRRMADLYRGELLEGSRVAWIDIDRLDVRGRIVTAHVRLGEFSLASGEPEEARDSARQALAIEPLSQRAARLFVRSLRGIGDVVGAHEFANSFLCELSDAGMPVEPETARVLGD